MAQCHLKDRAVQVLMVMAAQVAMANLLLLHRRAVVVAQVDILVMVVLASLK
jgi:hypothetical protein